MEWHDKPDWAHWENKLYLDPWECTALANDLTPETYVFAETNQATGQLVQNALHADLMPQDLLKKYYRVRDKFGNSATIHRKEFAQWALSEGWTLPAEFLRIAGITAAKERNLIQLNHAAITLAQDLWRDDDGQIEAANLTLKMQGMKPGNLHPVQAMRHLAESELQRDINALLKAKKIRLYAPVSFKPTLEIKNAWVDKNELVALLDSGAALPESVPELETTNAEMLDRINADIKAKMGYRMDKVPAPLYGEGFSEEMRKITTLTKWLKFETWTPIEAAMLVCGLQPSHECPEIPQEANGLEGGQVIEKSDTRFDSAKRVLQLWNRRENPPDKIRPADFVAWCKTKEINTDWLRDIEAAAMPQPESAPEGKAFNAPKEQGLREGDPTSPPGKQPNTAMGKLAIKAAWEIEQQSKMRATAKEVIELLQEWADGQKHTETLRAADKRTKSVEWVTGKLKPKSYDQEACGKALETWHKSRI